MEQSQVEPKKRDNYRYSNDRRPGLMAAYRALSPSGYRGGSDKVFAPNLGSGERQTMLKTYAVALLAITMSVGFAGT
jgi:hypothetical protein